MKHTWYCDARAYDSLMRQYPFLQDQQPGVIKLDFDRPIDTQMNHYVPQIMNTEPRLFVPDDVDETTASVMQMEVSNMHRRLMISAATHEQSWPFWYGNTLNNFERIKASTMIDKVDWPLKHKKALVVGNGESLRKTLPLIAGCREEYAIFACWRVVPRLQKYHIEPDIVAHIDMMDPVGGWEQPYLAKHIPLVVIPTVSPNFLKAYPDNPTYTLLGREGPTNIAWAEMLDIRCHEPAMGTVTMALIRAALYFGHQDIIMTGSDLCFENEAEARGTGYFVERLEKIKNADGEERLVTVQMAVYKDILEEAAKENPQVNFYNASPGGVALNGFKPWQFQEALKVA